MTATALGVRMPCLTRIQARSNPHRRYATCRVANGSASLFSCFWMDRSTSQLANGLGRSRAIPNIRPLCRSREVVLVHPLGKVTAITNLKIKHCKNSPMSQKKPICPSFARQNFNQFIAQSDEYLASFLSVGFAFSSDFFWKFALNLRQWLPKTHNLKLLVGFWFG